MQTSDLSKKNIVTLNGPISIVSKEAHVDYRYGIWDTVDEATTYFTNIGQLIQGLTIGVYDNYNSTNKKVVEYWIEGSDKKFVQKHAGGSSSGSVSGNISIDTTNNILQYTSGGTTYFYQLTAFAMTSPTISGTGTHYNKTSAAITISCKDTTLTIHYTTDGTNPTTSSPTIKSGTAFTVDNVENKSVTIKAMTVKGSVKSPIVTGTVLFSDWTPKAPTYSPLGGVLYQQGSDTRTITINPGQNTDLNPAGGTLMATTDGGTTWKPVSISEGVALPVQNTTSEIASANLATLRAKMVVGNRETAASEQKYPIYSVPKPTMTIDGADYSTSRKITIVADAAYPDKTHPDGFVASTCKYGTSLTESEGILSNGTVKLLSDSDGTPLSAASRTTTVTRTNSGTYYAQTYCARSSAPTTPIGWSEIASITYEVGVKYAYYGYVSPETESDIKNKITASDLTNLVEDTRMRVRWGSSSPLNWTAKGAGIYIALPTSVSGSPKLEFVSGGITSTYAAGALETKSNDPTSGVHKITIAAGTNGFPEGEYKVYCIYGSTITESSPASVTVTAS